MIQVAQMLFILSVLVILHEFGHYITAKMFKMKVEKFYLFLDIGFSLLKKKIGETEWGIGWLPFGGYVKIAGMIDESMDTDQMKQEPQPWEFRSKPAWQRLIVMLGGIIVNILLAVLIYSLIFSTKGKTVISTNKIQKEGLEFGVAAQKAGFKNGDKIIEVDGKFQPEFKWMTVDILLSDEVVVDRNGENVKLKLSDEAKSLILGMDGKSFMSARNPMKKVIIDSVSSKSFFKYKDQIASIDGKKFDFLDQMEDYLKDQKNKLVKIKIDGITRDTVVDLKVDKDGNVGQNKLFYFNSAESIKNISIGSVKEDSGADKAKLQIGDRFVSVNDEKLDLYIDLRNILKKNKSKNVELEILRNNKLQKVIVQVDKDGKIDFMPKSNAPVEFVENRKMSFLESIPAGIKETWTMFVYNIKQFKLILKPKTGAYKQVKSIIGIAAMLPEFWDWGFIWNFTALFSIGLAFMNLLPIPGLDGGHALFTIVEMVTGKKLSDKAAGKVQTVGMVILLSLMVLTFGKDIFDLVVQKFFK